MLTALPPQTAGVLVAGTRSGCGKTTLTLALLAALRRRGIVVQPCKVGPDFIDPTHHAAITGRASYNCDTWMGGEEGVLRVLAHMRRQSLTTDMLLAEGVMGLFDGAQGMGGPGSSAHLARVLRLPILLTVDARGMGQSTAALAAGYVRQQPELRFAGMVCTHVGGAGHAAMLQEAFAETFGDAGPPLLGLLPRAGLPELPSRHLGLLMAHEQGWSATQAAQLAAWCEAHMDVDALLQQCTPAPLPGAAPAGNTPALPPPLCAPAAPQTHRAPAAQHTTPPCRMGIARDEAFCFLYPDMPEVLRELGAEVIFFSPLRDAAPPPDCTSLYFPGGYPELHAARLAANSSMRDAVAAFAASGGRIYGECGGYMYLMCSVEYDGNIWPMSGCLPLRCRVGARRAALGYREVAPLAPSCFSANPAATGRGHEFHYADLTAPSPLPPLWRVRDRQGRSLPDEGVVHGGVAASWVHLYPEGARPLLHNLIHGVAHAHRPAHLP